MKNRLSRGSISLPLILIALIGCASGGNQGDPALQTTQSSPAGEWNVAPRSLEAWFDGNRAWIHYVAAGEDWYSEGTWSTVSDGSSEDGIAHLSSLPTADLFPHTLEPWSSPPPSTAAIPVHDVGAWRTVEARLWASYAPDAPGECVVIDVLRQWELAVFRDENGIPKAVPIELMPPDLTIAHSYSFDELMERTIPELKSIAEEENVGESPLLIDTGETGPYSIPFIIVDLAEDRVVFLRLVPENAARQKGPQGVTARATGHVLGSTVGMVVRPASSIARLFGWLIGTGAEPLKQTPVKSLEFEPIPPLADGEMMDLDEWARVLDRITGRPATSGAIEYLIDGKEFFPRLIDRINEAEDAVDIRTYIFDNDDYAIKIADLLKKRSKTGVRVRVLVDGVPTMTAVNSAPETLPPGYRGPDSIKGYLKKHSKVKVRNQSSPWMALDHTKTTIIDRSIAYTGGMNIGREYRYEWHDLMAELTGPVVSLLQRDFDAMWAYAGAGGDYARAARSSDPEFVEGGPGDVPMRVLLTTEGVVEIYRAHIQAARHAKRRIFVENAYFANDAILYELVKARRRGVDVRVILPVKGNWGTMNDSNVVAANKMLANGIRVYIYPGMSHVKAAVFDGWACFGSANIDTASLKTNQELNISTPDSAAVEELVSRLFEIDFERSVELTEPLPVNWKSQINESIADIM